MKKLSVICLVIVFGFVFSQNVYPNGYGIKGGTNFANVYNVEDFYDFETKTGFIVGGFYRFDLKGNLAIQPEVYFSMKGAKASGVDTYSYSGEYYSYTETETYDYSMELNYLEIPVLLKYQIPTRGKFKPALFLGPYVAFKMGAKLTGTYKYESTYEYDGEVYNEDYEENIDEELSLIERTDFGIVVGASLDIEVGSGSLIIDARYNLGLTGLSKFDEESDPGMKNSAFTLMLGYAFK